MTALQDIRDHRPEALEKLADQMRRQVRKMFRDSSTVEDVVQDSMIKVLNNVDRFDNKKSHVSTWAVRIAMNTAINHQRKQNRVKPLDDQRERIDTTNEQVEMLLEAIDDLPKEQRDVANLLIEGKTSKEISEELGIPVNLTYKRTYRLRKSLRERLE